MPSPAEDDGPTAALSDLHYLAIPAQADRLPALRRALARWAASVGMVADRVQELTLASYEAMANVVAHAYRGLPRGVWELHATYRATDRQIVVTVTDHGRWQPVLVNLDRLRAGGRGLPLIRAFAEDSTINSDAGGTRVRMRWHTT
ncbi:MAG TPA: ATP-binding protein [Pseudonocardiaceae bacterium]|jgi:anti-sigma regulatory factor (Ser/Thr protein kinase)|nr:ATP-binding protein [Pseudonocardiaceae bacterium]